MVAPNLHFEVLEEDVLAALAAMARATGSASLAMFLETVMEEWFEMRAARRFATEGDSASGKWEELLFPETHDIREAKGFPRAHPINRRTGELQDWVLTAGGTVSPFGSGDGAILTWPDLPTSDELRTKYDTAQRGKPNPYTPPRPVVAMDMVDLERALDALEKWIVHMVESPL